MDRNLGFIKHETLASALSCDGAGGRYSEQATIEGVPVGIGLTVTGTIHTVSYG